MTLEQLLARAVRDPDTGCLRWQGAKNKNGYGRVHAAGRSPVLVHRLVVELAHGPIPDGYVVDHVYDRGCRHVDCIEPSHLEAVTCAENCRRSSLPRMVTARTGICARGHRIEGENAQVEANGVRCRRCAIERKRAARRDRARAARGVA